uniref:transposase family protein n=1 Tax=Streptomyces asoensis TaxID=249586 RepID=UPI00209C02D1|nr:transposase family protein [Streptomyces asoensis]
MRRPAVGRKDRDEFISGKTRRNAVRSMILTDAGGRILFAGAVLPGSCADITQPCQLGRPGFLSTPRSEKSSQTPAAKAWAHRPADTW